MGLKREMPLFRRSLRDHLGKPKSAAKMPRAVKRAIEVGERVQYQNRIDEKRSKSQRLLKGRMDLPSARKGVKGSP
jgi:hypothetical protein